MLSPSDFHLVLVGRSEPVRRVSPERSVRHIARSERPPSSGLIAFTLGKTVSPRREFMALMRARKREIGLLEQVLTLQVLPQPEGKGVWPGRETSSKETLCG